MLTKNKELHTKIINSFKKQVLFFIAVIIFVSTISSTGLLSLNNSYVSAANKASTPDEEATAYYYANGLIQCVLHGMDDHKAYTTQYKYNKSDVESGDVFWKNPAANLQDDNVWGAYGTFIGSSADDKGTIDCGDDGSEIMKNAFEFFGIKPVDFLCGVGAVKAEKGQKCGSTNAKTYTNEKSSASKMVGWLNKNLGYQPFELSDAGRYVYSLNSLRGSCTRGISSVGKKSDAGDGAFSVKGIDGKDAWYTYADGYNTHTKVKYRSNANTNWECIDIIKSINATNAAFLKWNKDHPDNPSNAGGATGKDDGAEGEAANCHIDKLGWLLCPIFELMGGISDGAYKLVKSMLTVPPLLTGGDSQGVYNAWKSMRNVANVAFVIAFLIIIFSQVTSIGFSNYNIKKMVPRLVMAAILVNISFWICAIAVDLSNIIGSSLKSVFDGMKEGIKVSGEASGFWDYNDGGGPLFAAIVTYVIAGGAAVATGAAATGGILALLAALVPMLITVALAIVTVFVVLTARQAIIILLIVISPLAFVAMLLPNTENWFTRWRQLLQIMLLMFPIIAAIFGASALAALVVMNSNTDSIPVQILGAGIAVIPLALTPIVMKTAGGVLGKIGAFVNNPNRGPLDSLKKKAADYGAYRKNVTKKDFMNPDMGKNKFSRAWRKGVGAPTRLGARMNAKGEKAAASAEAAEAGYMMKNDNAAEAIRIRAATAGAKSAQNAEAIKKFDKDAAKSALGLEGSESTSLAAALRSQEKSGEDQLIKEFQTIHGPKDGEELEKALQRAIEKDDEYEAQAIENILEGMGNKGAAVMGHVIENNGDSMSSTMRTELARNMGANVMGKNEVAKNWATSTAPEIDENGNLAMEDMKDKNGNVVYDENGKAKKQVKLKADEPKLNEKGEQQYNEDGSVKMKGLNKSYSDAKSQVMKSEMKLDKIKSQESNTQSQYVHSGSMSIETMQQAIQPQHSGSFEPKDLEYMKKQIEQSIKTSSGSGNSQQKPMPTPEVKVNIESSNPSPSAPAQGGGSLKVEHTYKNPPSSAPAPAPQKLTDAQIRDALRDQNKEDRN